MWRHPYWVTRPFAVITLTQVLDHRLDMWTFPRGIEYLEGKKPFEALRHIFTLVQHAFVRAGNDRERSVLDAFCSEYTKEVQTVLNAIDRKRCYDDLPMMWEAQGILDTQIPAPVSVVMHSFLTAIYLLLGSEDRCLIGTRDHVPTWKKLGRRIKSEEEAWDLAAKVDLTTALSYVTQDDVAIVPALDEWGEAIQSHPWPDVGMDSTRQRLEEAYYSQRYTVHPEGAYVKLVGCPPITAMLLKVRKGIRDPNYVDFLARFETELGQYFYVLDGEVGTGSCEYLGGGPDDRFARFFSYLIAQIYHDLVTAIEIPMAPPSYMGTRVARGAAQESPRNVEDISWIYIPRIVHRKSQEPRRPVDSPNLFKPRWVSGYKRPGNMTEAHRLELLKYEEESGLEILKWLPKDHTFVRPHVSPGDSWRALVHLPRFIRSRIQEDIKRILTSSNN